MFEFLEYKAIPNEKYLGIVTIRGYGKIIMKFKIIPGKEERSFFHSVPSYKVGVDAMGKDIYEKSFMIDSQYESKLLDDCIRANVNPYQASANQQAPKNPVPVFGQNQKQQVGTYFDEAYSF